MVGMGTLVNAIATIAGGIIGLLLKRGLAERYRDMVMKTLGLAVIFLAISGALSKMFVLGDTTIETQGSLMIILTLLFGGLFGEWVDLDGRVETFGNWLRKKAKSESDSDFIEGFVATSLTICVGAMAVVGALEDGLTGNTETLYLKAVLDFVIVTIFAAAYGKGVIFSVIPLVLIQGSITAFARVITPFLTPRVIDNISMVGSMLLFCVGVNMMFKLKIKVANMLPSLIFVVLYSLLII